MLFGELFVIMSGLGRGVRESTYIHSLSPAPDLVVHCLSGEKEQKLSGRGEVLGGCCCCAPEAFGARYAERTNQIETTFVPFKFPICPLAVLALHQLTQLYNSQRDLRQEGLSRSLPFSPRCLQQGAEAQNHLSSSAAPLPPRSEMW